MYARSTPGGCTMQPIDNSTPPQRSPDSTRILERLAEGVGPKNYENWFLGRCTVTVEDDEVCFGVGSPFVVSWMQRQFREALQSAATVVL